MALGPYSHLHIWTLWAFACAQPLLQKLADFPEFFVAKQATPELMLAFVASVVVLPPTLLTTLSVLLGFAHRGIQRVFHLATLSCLLLLTFVPILTTLGLSGWLAMLAGGCTSAAVLVLYSTRSSVRSFASALGVLVLVAPILFLTNSEIRSFLLQDDAAIKMQSGERTTTPVILVVFDELSLSILVDAEQQIDDERFPNFARLSKDATWFRNATANSDYTTLAVPAILTGRLPAQDRRLPTHRYHPQNIFTLLASTHTLHVRETMTQLCPRGLCDTQQDHIGFWSELSAFVTDSAAVYLSIVVPPDLGIPLPNISSNWGDFWDDDGGERKHGHRQGPYRVQIFRDWIKDISSDTPRPSFNFIHSVLPHVSYQFLPSGARYRAPQSPIGYVEDRWLTDPWAPALGMQQLLMQVGTIDTLLGELRAKLEAENLWDRSLLIVTTDHGVSFEEGANRRGELERPRYFDDIVRIPLFVKLPGQKIGGPDDRNVMNIDIVPTILDILALPIPDGIDGLPMFSEAASSRTEKPFRTGLKPTHARAGDLSKAYQLRSFPMPSSLQTAQFYQRTTLFPVGPFALSPFELQGQPAIVGSRVSELPMGEPSQLTRTPRTSELKFDPSNLLMPALLQFSLSSPRHGRWFALSFDDQIVAMTTPFERSAYRLAFIVPEEAMKQGSTVRVRVWEIEGGKLRRVAGSR